MQKECWITFICYCTDLRGHDLRVRPGNVDPGVHASPVVCFDDVGPCGPGKPFLGQPNGWPSTSSSVYSCSIPNHGCWSSAFVMASRHDFLLFESTMRNKTTKTSKNVNPENTSTKTSEYKASQTTYYRYERVTKKPMAAKRQRWVQRKHLLLDSAPNIGPLISRWELDKFKNCWFKSFRTSKILTLLYQQFSNLLIYQRDTSGPRLGALSNNRRSGALIEIVTTWRKCSRTVVLSAIVWLEVASKFDRLCKHQLSNYSLCLQNWTKQVKNFSNGKCSLSASSLKNSKFLLNQGTEIFHFVWKLVLVNKRQPKSRDSHL